MTDDTSAARPATPVLDRVHQPADLKDLSDRELRQLADELRAETKAAEANYDSLSEASRKYYTQALSNVFNESAELLVEFSTAADRSTEAAVMYHGMLVDQYEIVNKYNQDLEEK